MKSIIQTIIMFIIVQSTIAQNNVGIGTNTPNASAKLDITDANKGILIPRVALTASNAAGPITSPANSLLVYNTANASSGATLVTPGYYYWNGTAWIRLLNSKTINANNGLSVVSDTLIQLGGTLNKNTSIEMAGFSLAFPQTSGTAIANQFSVDGTTFSVDALNDRVGVGIASPSAKLEVNGAATQAVLELNGTNNPEILLQNNGSTRLEIGIATGASAYITNSAVNDVIVRQTGGQKILFSSSASGTTNDLTISGGNVGVNTSAPAYKLDVNGTINATDFGAAGSQNIRVGDDAYLSDVDAAHTMAIQSTTSNAASYLHGSAGNIGVGTTTLNAKLDVAGILAMNDYAIRLRPGTDANHQVVFNSTVDGPSIEGCSGIQFKKNCTAEVLGTWNTTALDVQNSQIYAREGIKTRKSYQYFRSMADEDDAWTKDLGSWDICYLAGVSMYMDNNFTWDIDNQCNVYPAYNTLDDYYGDGGGNNTLYSSSVETIAYNTKLSWKLYVESYIDNDAVYCGVICMNFE